MLNTIARLVVLILLLLPALGHAETKENTKSWNMAIITGPLSADKRIKYYLQPQINFIDDKYKIHNVLGYVGLGYQLDTYKIAWLMNGYSWGKTASGNIHRIDIIRQQLNWNMSEAGLQHVSSITRLEERKDLGQPMWNVRLRQQIQLRLPFESWPGHAFVTYDEIFINLNHPAWIHSSTFVEQNRIFIGIGTTLSTEAELDIGYINQYQFRNPHDEMSNVLQVRLSINVH